MLKKSQITVFIIITIIIILSFLIYLFLIRNNHTFNDETIINFDNQIINLYVEDIAKEYLTIATYFLSLRGGYIYDFEEKLITETGPFAYHIKNEIEPPDLNFITNEIEIFLSENLKKELDKKSFEGIEVEFNEVISDIIISQDYILANLQIKTEIDSKTKIEMFEYNIRVPIRLGYVLDFRDKIISDFKNNPNQISNFAYEEVDVSIFPFNENTFIFSIVDHETLIEDTPLVYNFAVEYTSFPKPRLNFIPNFVTNVNVPINYQLSSTYFGTEELIYTVNSSLINLDLNQGNFTFVSYEEGEFYFNFCVEDNYNKDCDEVRIIVKE